MTTVKVKSVLVPYQQTTEQFLSSGSPKRTQQPPVCSTTETIYSIANLNESLWIMRLVSDHITSSINIE